VELLHSVAYSRI